MSNENNLVKPLEIISNDTTPKLETEILDGNKQMEEFLQLANSRLADEINFLRKMVEELQIVNRLLIDKVGWRESKPVLPEEDFSPIGGYVSLRQRILSAEEDSRKEAENASEIKETI